MVFFGISLAILIMALLAYSLAFLDQFSREQRLSKKLGLFVSLLPISPLIPYIMYFTTNPQSAVSKFIESNCCFNVKFDDREWVSDNVSALRQFMEQKIEKHLGFIIEALVEGIYNQLCIIQSFILAHDISITQHFRRQFYKWSPL